VQELRSRRLHISSHCVPPLIYLLRLLKSEVQILGDGHSGEPVHPRGCGKDEIKPGQSREAIKRLRESCTGARFCEEAIKQQAREKRGN